MHAHSKYSIGGYHIRNKEVREGSRDYPEVEAELWCGDRRMGWLTDKGDGGGPRFDLDRNNGLRDAKWEKPVRDMKHLFSLLGSNLHPEAIATSFTDGVEQALVGFHELLEELEVFTLYADKAYKHVGPDTWYFVAQAGGGCLSEYTPDMKPLAARIKDQTAVIRTVSNIAGHLRPEEVGRDKQLYTLAVLRGSLDWNLSLEDYAELHNPYSYLEDFK